MFEQLDMDTIGYFNFMEQEEKNQREEREALQYDLRISQNHIWTEESKRSQTSVKATVYL